MKFIVIARDGTDQDALNRRLKARADHIAMGDEAVKAGEQLLGAAMLNDEEQMTGSVLLVDFPSRKELDEWLKIEPYVTGDVWQNIEIMPCKIGPSFDHIIKKPECH